MSFIVPHDAKSWIPVEPDSHFPIQNLPFCTYSKRGDESGLTQTGVRIGDHLVTLDALYHMRLLRPTSDESVLDLTMQSVSGMGLDDIMFPVPFELWEYPGFREQVYHLLRDGSGELRDHPQREEAILPVDACVLHLPTVPFSFVDFYSGINHASNVGRMFRPDQPPLLPNYRHLPVGYNGRASSVVQSGWDIVRPKGQQKVGEDVVFGPTRELDFELEMGFFVSRESEMGEPIPIAECEDHIVGMVIVNDWSARDVQRWEYQPLGPFLSKSFATSVSPYIVTLDALEPFRIEGQPQDPQPLPHLRHPAAMKAHYDIHLEVAIQSERMTRPQTICRSNTKHLYWSMVQQLAHQTSNGTPVQEGDLYASGTISGTEPDSFGSMLELTWRGERPITLEETGETRKFLEDGDTVIMTAYAQGDGYRIGFGEVRASVLPSPGA